MNDNDNNKTDVTARDLILSFYTIGTIHAHCNQQLVTGHALFTQSAVSSDTAILWAYYIASTVALIGHFLATRFFHMLTKIIVTVSG